MSDRRTTVFREARLVDGTGAPARDADVVVADGRIVEVAPPRGAGTAHAHRVIDAEGLLLTPGWVDIHTHYDAQATWDPWLTPSSWHGVTTAIMGNCGVGFAPAAEDRHEWLIELMEGVEDIPGSAMTEGLTWGWRSFPEYLDVLDSLPRVLDIGTQIGHGALRAFVMGDRGAANESATAADIAAMADLVEEAVRAGAFGFSTSRTPVHRSKSGELVPGTTAGDDEILGIAAAVQRAGGGTFQFAPEHVRLAVDEWPWMRELASRNPDVTVSVNLNQSDDGPHIWREVLGLLEQADRDGLSIIAQVAGRSIGMMMCLESSFHPLMFHPAHGEVAHLPFAERLRALREPARRERLVHEIPADDGFFEKVVLAKVGKYYPVTDADVDYEPSPDRSVAAISTRRRVPPMEVIVDHMLSRDGKAMIYQPIFNYAYGDLSMTHELSLSPLTRMGLSDAGAHCGAICDGGMPTFMLTHWTRDRSRGPRLPLEHVVHRQSLATARTFGLDDRGSVEAGKRADLNLIDYDALGFDMPTMAYDLPANGKRLVQRATGYVATFVAGVQTVDHDEFTGELPGRLLRR
jgi:N-acyl-D-aspartate/D-glutamate deacylase